MKDASIKGIAAALNISIGTVDRALHGRRGISPATRAQVLDTAKALGYKPNFAARSLKRNRSFRLGIYLPAQFGPFFDAIRDGILSACAATTLIDIEPQIYRFPRLDDGDVTLLESHRAEHFDACIVAPGNPAHIEATLRSLVADGTPVFCVSTDAPDSGRTGSVTADAFTSGAMAAELLARILPRPGAVAVMTGELTTMDHAEKLRGFRHALLRWAPHLELHSVVESHEQPDRVLQQTLQLLDAPNPPAALYVNTAFSIPVVHALERRELLGVLPLVTTDLFTDILTHLRSGAIVATLHQRPFTQGKVVVEQLIHYLTEGVVAPAEVKLAPHLVMRSNLDLFLQAET